MEKNVNKFLILICYYNRPNLVRYALSSLKNQSYKNWQALVVDDGSDISCEDSIKEILREEATKVKYINTLMSKKDKESIGGSLFGLYWNHACIAYDCDFAIMLCDDDALMPDYLENLNKFFQENLNRKWIYSHVKYYDPFCQTDFKNIKTCMEVNQPIYELNPDSRLDASQVAFSLDAFKTYGAEFGYPLTANLDSDLYRKLHPVYGNCCFSGFFSQYKGYASSRLETRQFNAESIYSNNIDVNIDPAQEN
jgi:glycosyltransferase involved in cell wall biosynthesis